MNSRLKDIAGRIPAAAGLYDMMRPGRPRTRYNLEQLAERLPTAADEARPYAARAAKRSRLVLFATLHYWIEQAAILGIVLRAIGHDVTIAYLPYSTWEKEINSFDLKRQDLYTRRVLTPAKDLLHVEPLLDRGSAGELPTALQSAVRQGAGYDVMYSLQDEQVDVDAPLYRLRLERNNLGCRAALDFLQAHRPDAVLVPNGLVTELGMFYQAARHLGIHAITYEFNDQREQIWVAHNDIVMYQNTDALWKARGSRPLSDIENERIREFEAAREGARTYAKGTRLWQDAPSKGSGSLRKSLGLDGRPVALLATNVLGDSLTLGRNLFASSMAEWIAKTVIFFAARPDVQLVVRIHPGERLIKGPSIRRIIDAAVKGTAKNILIIGAEDKINTYDAMGVADLGLAYTTTVGMEMSMRGIPVITAGKTHYRERGFVLAPTSWEEYFAMLEKVLQNPAAHRLTPQQIDVAWNYGYRFFFEYPMEFPWRLMHFWRDVGEWPVARVLSDEGRAAFGSTFAHLAGGEMEWWA